MKKAKTLVLFLLVSFCAMAQPPAATVPDFTFFKFDKTPFPNKSLPKNKHLFFIFFDVECDHCQQTISAINKDYKKLSNAAIYLITLNNQVMVNVFMNKYAPNLKDKNNILILQDVNNEFIAKFKPQKYPSLFLYSAQKKLLLYSDDEKKLPLFFSKIEIGN